MLSNAQWTTVGQSCAALWLYISQRSCTTVSGEEEKDEMQKMSWTFLCGGVFSHERTGIIVFCIVRTFILTVLFAQFPLCRMLVLNIPGNVSAI